MIRAYLIGVMRLLDAPDRQVGGRISTEEVDAVTETSGTTNQGAIKTIGVKLPDEIHAQLVLIASLDEVSLTDAIRQAIEYFIERKRSEGDLAARAARASEEIERDAKLRREALQALFGQHAPATAEEAGGRRRSSAKDQPTS